MNEKMFVILSFLCFSATITIYHTNLMTKNRDQTPPQNISTSTVEATSLYASSNAATSTALFRTSTTRDSKTTMDQISDLLDFNDDNNVITPNTAIAEEKDDDTFFNDDSHFMAHVDERSYRILAMLNKTKSRLQKLRALLVTKRERINRMLSLSPNPTLGRLDARLAEKIDELDQHIAESSDQNPLFYAAPPKDNDNTYCNYTALNGITNAVQQITSLLTSVAAPQFPSAQNTKHSLQNISTLFSQKKNS